MNCFIPSGSKLACQRCYCINYVRLSTDFTDKIDEFACATCLGYPYSIPGKSPIAAGNYTTCSVCDCQFKVGLEYRGKKPMCHICRNQVPQESSDFRVPSLVGTKNFVANSIDKKNSPKKYEQATKINWDNFNYPISCCSDDEGSWTISNKGPNPDIEIGKLLDASTFCKVYYRQVGENDGDDWVFIIQRKDGVYVYFKASCDYTGFDCQGGGNVSYSREWSIFWDMCLDTNGRSCLV